jgi:type II restriction/modification system DNA methylase subunit YeeA
MDTSSLKKFAQAARRQLIEQVAARMEQVLRTDSVEIREKAQAVEELKKEIGASSKAVVVDKVAYTWFNRFCALRFMDVNHYTSIGVVSPIEGHTQPEVLAEAKLGVIDDAFGLDKARVFDLLNGQYPSSNPQQEAYRLLLKGACNALHDQMPFLFPKIDDYTELLMPDDLLSENSVLQGVRETLTPAACEDVEVIGWLYQYYISERKDEVFAALKKNQKIEAEDIPAATQLFTPHWIVRYLVENSLGRLWLLNRPHSKLAAAMDYYIAPEQAETDFLQLGSPEEIKVADPACGSGHMLTYAFDLLYAIYEEEGYDSVEIPRLILEKNLYGIEIDERAGNLAAFALVMKARAKDRRFFRRKVEPNICVLENVYFSPSELDAYKKKVGNDLFTQDLWFLLTQFEQADNFGSLIRPQVKHPEQMLKRLEELGAFDDLLLFSTNEKVKRALKQAEHLSPRYHVVITNPPYMGELSMNEDLKDHARDFFANNYTDLFAMFIDRSLEFILPGGYVAMITMQSWMFLSSYEELRKLIIQQKTVLSMCHFGARAFDSIGGEIVSTTAFVLSNEKSPSLLGVYLRLIDGTNETEKNKNLLENIPSTANPTPPLCYKVSLKEFKKIPGYPIAYWSTKKFRESFEKYKPLHTHADCIQGIITGNTKRFLRFWHEVSYKNIAVDSDSMDSIDLHKSYWIPYTKGGGFRKWFGNIDYVINWKNNGTDLVRARTQNAQYYLKPCLTWTLISSASFCARMLPQGFLWDVAGSVAFPLESGDIYYLLGILSSKFSNHVIKTINPTINTNIENVQVIPVADKHKQPKKTAQLVQNVHRAVEISKDDWNDGESSLYFSTTPLLRRKSVKSVISATYSILEKNWRDVVSEIQSIENENNETVFNAYELQDEPSLNTTLEEITLFCNPHYRYGANRSQEELKGLLLADTMKEFISYGVGCMFGRYSLDKPGLVLANQGEEIDDFRRQLEDSGVAWDEVQFTPDEDNVIPILDGEWFADDIAERFKQFLKITFGTEHYEENLAFLEEAIGRDIRSYFVKDFYNNHVKMYKKRPIYWLFSSPKGSFNALVYMHRYRPDTVSVILNGYLRQYREKLKAHKSHQEAIERNPGASQGEKTKALKEIERVDKIQAELKEYEDEVLYPLATRQIEIDLDDGVKANYPRFGDALKKVSGLSK